MNATVEHKPFDKTQAAGQRTLLWIGLGSVVMLFAAFTSAYIVQRSTGKWVNFRVPDTFYISSVAILVVSLFMHMALKAGKEGNRSKLSSMILATMFMIGVFTGAQYYGWTKLVSMGIYAIDQNSVAGPFMYIITGVHVLHLVGGWLALGVMFYRSRKNEISEKMKFGLQQCATYIHVIGFIWIYLHIFFVINQNF